MPKQPFQFSENEAEQPFSTGFTQQRSHPVWESPAGYLTDRAHDDLRSVGKFVNASVSHSALGRYMLRTVGRYLGRYR